MKARPDTPLDEVAFARMKRILPTYLAGRRNRTGSAVVRPLPDEIAFKLTNQCNLRCRHFYQWGEGGHHHGLERAEQLRHLPFALFAKVLEATCSRRSNLYLWGGEPLLYRHWDHLVDLLERDPRWTSICTNGLVIERRLESLLRISPRLELDVAVDGLEDEHDALRGPGAFARTLRGIGAVLEQRRQGRYHGEITVNCVITDALVPSLAAVVEFWQEIGIDTLYLALPWFLSPAACEAMDRYVEDHRPWPGADIDSGEARPSWHAYSHQTSAALAEPLLEQLHHVNGRSWRLKLRYNPALGEGEIADFLAGSGRPAAGRTRCLAILSRMDIMPNGDIVSCKFFPESTVGNLHHDEAVTAWHGERFAHVREVVAQRGLMPVCAKCSLLYSRGA